MRPSVETPGDFRLWIGRADRNSGVGSTIHRFATECVSVVDETEYKTLLRVRTDASDKDKHLFERWIQSNPRIAIRNDFRKLISSDVNLSNFLDAQFPLDKCLESKVYKEVEALRSDPITTLDTVDQLFNRKFGHLLPLSRSLTLVDRYFGVNFLKPGSGAQFFLQKVAGYNITLNIWTSNPSRDIKYDFSQLEMLVKKYVDSLGEEGPKLTVRAAGRQGSNFMHDRMGYLSFFRGRLYFKIGRGVEIFSDKQFGRSFEPSTLDSSPPEPNLDSYLGGLLRDSTTRTIIDTCNKGV